MNKRFNDAIQRISEIRWGEMGEIEKKSHVALAKEYIRRAALLIQSCSLNTKFPFFNAAQAVGKNPKIDIEKVYPQIGNIENVFARRVCECYIEWSILVDLREPIAIQFCDLYEPLIILFERGGTIGLHHGEVVVGKYAFPLGNPSSIALEDPIDISDSGLEKWNVD